MFPGGCTFGACDCYTTTDTELCVNTFLDDSRQGEKDRQNGQNFPGSASASSLLLEEQLEERERLQGLIRAFVKQGVAGVKCTIVNETTGEREEAKYRLEHSLSLLTLITDAGCQISISMKTLGEILRYTADSKLGFGIQELSDKDKSRLVFFRGGGETNFLLMPSEEERDRFITCFKILTLYAAM